MNRESLLEVVRAYDSEPKSLTLSESDMTRDNTSLVGQVLDEKYELVRKIGEGGMGEVYEARHRILGRRFAVKLLHPELARSQRMLRRFSREALSASRIENNHVVAIADCGHLPDGAPYYVMDFLRGRDLRGVLRECGDLPIRRAARLVQQICCGLNAAHELGLVHRDLKPENIFVERRDDGTDCAKILDFGVVQTDGGNSTAKTGALIGTLKYMAPEQARGDAALDHRADLYAVGSILYECLTGQVPHPGRNTEEVLFHIMTQSPLPLDQLRADVPPDLLVVTQRALSREPADRFQSALEFAEALSPHTGEIVERFSHARTRQAGPHDGTISDHSYARSAPTSDMNQARASVAWRRKGLALIGLAAVSVAVWYVAGRTWSRRSSPTASRTSDDGARPLMLMTKPGESSSKLQTAPSSISALPAPRASDGPEPAKLARASAVRPRSTQPPAKVNESNRADEYSQKLDLRNPYAAHPR